MATDPMQTERRRGDPYLDQRSGEDRRQVHLLSYFSNGGIEQRRTQDRRVSGERRKGYIRVTQWSSVCMEVITSPSDDAQ